MYGFCLQVIFECYDQIARQQNLLFNSPTTMAPKKKVKKAKAKKVVKKKATKKKRK